jgi:hypothetical protein
MGEDAFLYIIGGEEVNVYDCKRRSAHVSTREEANAYECKRRSVCVSAREEACMLSCESLI